MTESDSAEREPWAVERNVCAACAHPVFRRVPPEGSDGEPTAEPTAEPTPWRHAIESSSQSGHAPRVDPVVTLALTHGRAPDLPSTVDLFAAREARASLAIDRDPRAQTIAWTSDPSTTTESETT